MQHIKLDFYSNVVLVESTHKRFDSLDNIVDIDCINSSSLIADIINCYIQAELCTNGSHLAILFRAQIFPLSLISLPM